MTSRGRKLGHGKGCPRTSAFCADSIARKSGGHSCGWILLFGFFGKPHPRIYPRVRCSGPATIASNLEVFGRGLAAIGNLFVFHRLSFVERGKASFLDRRNMNENVLAAA